MYSSRSVRIYISICNSLFQCNAYSRFCVSLRNTSSITVAYMKEFVLILPHFLQVFKAISLTDLGLGEVSR